MVHIDNVKCTGCGYCVDICPQQAIAIDSGVAVINQDLCVECGTCAEVCPVGAIWELAPVNKSLEKRGDTMPYGYGRGFGFRGASLAWPYVGRSRGGLPRRWHPGSWRASHNLVSVSHWSAPIREDELGFLKDQACIMKRQLEDVERRIQELEKKE
jgi:NAD-dependent dihydropyrimidine dehydrogenase PreA subunit